ncbi:transposase [Sunxiuqinia sp. sy24]|uniref:transposase n=1 Tax=Sunxiuqinia sp. sy24 TaxID=3461495 RepID=UPI004046111B
MQQFEQLKHRGIYHIYSHGVGGRDLFRDSNNYDYFLALYDKYISPIARTYAWVLMKNHFHLLVRIKEEEEVVASPTPDRVLNPIRDKNDNSLKIGTPSQQFSKLFNAYAQAYNKYHKTRGALFERPFKRKLIDNKAYLRDIILYIHNNPVHHGFCEHPVEYPWSSYLSCISMKPSKLHRKAVIGWFDDKANFKTMHNQKVDVFEMEKWLEI